LARAADSGIGGSGGNGSGGGLANFGAASFTGITIDFRANLATGGAGGQGGAGGTAFAGNGGGGNTGGNGFTATGGNGSDGGAGGRGLGGAIWTSLSSRLTIDPRLGAKRGSKQSMASNTITLNQANLGAGGAGGAGGDAQGGRAGLPGGVAGLRFPGRPGNSVPAGTGLGGGVARFAGGNITIENTNITGNIAATTDNDVTVIPQT
jgi:hypothetical protein